MIRKKSYNRYHVHLVFPCHRLIKKFSNKFFAIQYIDAKSVLGVELYVMKDDVTGEVIVGDTSYQLK